jgi:Raf kinase inhibitor-like YbhB/YbcL family protein
MADFLHSAAFLRQQPIPRRFTCDGEDISPELAWHGVPEHTEAFALMMEDPDAPLGVFTHWVYCDLPGALRELPEDVEKIDRPSLGGVQRVPSVFLRRSYRDAATLV